MLPPGLSAANAEAGGVAASRQIRAHLVEHHTVLTCVHRPGFASPLYYLYSPDDMLPLRGGRRAPVRDMVVLVFFVADLVHVVAHVHPATDDAEAEVVDVECLAWEEGQWVTTSARISPLSVSTLASGHGDGRAASPRVRE